VEEVGLIISLDNLGEIGLVSDRQPHTLPPNAFSNALNVRFYDGEVRRVLGNQQIVTVGSQAMWSFPYQYVDSAYWVFASPTSIGAWDGETFSDISPTSMLGSTNDLWNGGFFAGVAVLNNGRQAPFYWGPDLVQADTLPNWNPLWRAKVIRPFRNMLIAFNMTESATRYPTKYRWSSLADPGSVPASWDDSDPTVEAGFGVLEDTSGEIVDAEPLDQYLVVYKEDSTYLLSFVGGQFVLNERPLLKKQGILTQRCAKEFNKRHFVADFGEIYIHDGQTPTSIMRGRVYKKVFPRMDEEHYTKSFVVPNWKDEEMWFCFPEQGHSLPNIAAMWNWRSNTWSFRELPDTAHIGYGILSINEKDIIDDNTNIINTQTQLIDQRLFAPFDRQLVAVTDLGDGLTPGVGLTPAADLTPSSGTSKMTALEQGFQVNGEDMICEVERRGLRPERGPGNYMIRAAYPRVEGTDDIQLWFGSQDSPNASVLYDGPFSFTPGVSNDKINLRVTGRYLSWKVRFPGSSLANLAGVEIDVVKVGER
jgi:hypothetical protein